MKTASLLIMLLSSSGHWLSGADVTVTVSWTSAAREATPAARLVWQLNLDGVTLAKDEAPLKPHPADGGQAEPAAVIALRCPEVRARVPLRFAWRLVRADDGREIDRGEVPVAAYPNTLTAGWSRITQGRTIAVVDGPEGLPRLFDAAKVQYTRVNDPADLGLSRPDVILVGDDALDASPFTQAPLLAQARAGASVMILRQTRPRRLAEYHVAARSLPARFDFERDHPLFAGLDPDDLNSWLMTRGADATADPLALELPPDDPSVAVAAWPAETSQKPGAAPIAALLVTKAVGDGRLVLCQMPLGPPTTDPRAQIFLGNALDYLLSRPGPTPPPSQRRRSASQPVVVPLPTIVVPAGDKP